MKHLNQAGYEVNPVLNEAYEKYIKTKQTGRIALLAENDFPYMGMYGKMAGITKFQTLEASSEDLIAQNSDAITSIDSYNDLGVVVLGRAASEGVDWEKGR